MRWSDLDFSPSSRTLRQFSLIWILVLSAMACWQAFLGGRYWLGGILAIVAFAIGVPGLFRPQAIRAVYVAALVIAFPIGFVVSRLLLAAVFYGVFTPLGLVFKLLGRDALRIRRSSAEATYWQPKTTSKDLARYLRQF